MKPVINLFFLHEFLEGRFQLKRGINDGYIRLVGSFLPPIATQFFINVADDVINYQLVKNFHFVSPEKFYLFRVAVCKTKLLTSEVFSYPTNCLINVGDEIDIEPHGFLTRV